MAGTSVTRWRSCNRRRQDIASRMRPQAHLPVPRDLTSLTRATATVARLPISRVPYRILRKAMALSRVRLDRWLLTNTFVEGETTDGGLAWREMITRVPRRLPRLPVTTTVTRRILQAIRTTAGTSSRLYAYFFCGVRSRDARSVPSLLLLCLFSSMRIIANKEIRRLRKESLKFWSQTVISNKIIYPYVDNFITRLSTVSCKPEGYVWVFPKDTSQFFRRKRYLVQGISRLPHELRWIRWLYHKLCSQRTHPGNKMVQWHCARKHRGRVSHITSDSLGGELINRRFGVHA